MTIKTKFANKNPFTGARVHAFDPAEIVIQKNPSIPAQKIVPSKYDPVFSKVEIGQCMIVPLEEVERIGQAFRMFLKKYKLPGQVRTFSRRPDITKAMVYRIERES